MFIHNNYYADEGFNLDTINLWYMYSQVKDDADFTFISEVFAGCVRYQGLIKVQYTHRNTCTYIHKYTGTHTYTNEHTLTQVWLIMVFN